jgi:hypothetical protein
MNKGIRFTDEFKQDAVAHYAMLAKRWKNGRRIAIGAGRIRRWET